MLLSLNVLKRYMEEKEMVKREESREAHYITWHLLVLSLRQLTQLFSTKEDLRRARRKD